MAGSKSAICARSAREKIELAGNGAEDDEEADDDAGAVGAYDDDNDETSVGELAAVDSAGALAGGGMRAKVPRAGLSAVWLSCCCGWNLCHAPSGLTSVDQHGCIVPVENRLPKMRVDRKKASMSAVQCGVKWNERRHDWSVGRKDQTTARFKADGREMEKTTMETMHITYPSVKAACAGGAQQSRVCDRWTGPFRGTWRMQGI